MKYRKALYGLICLLTSFNGVADEPVKRHGVVVGHEAGVRFEGGITATLQHASDDRVKDESLASADLLMTMPTEGGKWVVYFEANLSPRTDGVSSLIGEANGDAGSALDRDGDGRVQISEIHYSHAFGENTMSIGVINPSCVLDSSDVANDETSQFIGASFVNNPTIEFPDYSLGVCTHINENNDRPGLNLTVTSSHGLGDNPDVSYADLFDVGKDGKGLFVGAELYRSMAKGKWRLGIWTNTAEHDYLDGSGRTGRNYGAYVMVDRFFAETKWNLRLGVARGDVSEARNFVGIAMETPLAGNTLGVGLSRTGVSDELGAGSGDTTHAEMYYRYDVNDSLHITPSIQWIRNSSFDNTDTSFDDDLAIAGVRVTWSF